MRLHWMKLQQHSLHENRKTPNISGLVVLLLISGEFRGWKKLVGKEKQPDKVKEYIYSCAQEK